MLHLMVLTLSVVALVLAVVAHRRQGELSQRLDSLTRRVNEILERHAEPGGRLSDASPPTAEKPVELGLEEFDLGEPAAPPRPEPLRPPPPPDPEPLRPVHTIPASQGLERQFGTRVAVWLGAIALALAGAFLVKYTIERGLIGPTARVLLGLLFGLSLLGIGEWIAKRYESLAQGLDAAGIAVLYSVLLAGFRLYGLYPAPIAFLGMLLTTVAAVVLSLRRGQLVAALGLLGGFLTPILIGSAEPRPWMLLIYLVLLQSGLLVVSRRMQWWRVAGLTLVGVMGWALFWMSDLAGVGGSTLQVALLLTVSMASFVFSAEWAPRSGSWRDPRAPRVVVWFAVGVGTALLAALVGVGDFGLTEWAFFGLVGAGCIALGRNEATYEGLAWIASLTGAALLWLWGSDLGSQDQMLLWRVALMLAALFAGGSYWAMWQSARPGRWAAMVSVSGTTYFLAAYAGLYDQTFAVPWGVQALLLAAAFVGLAIPVHRRRDSLHEGSTALAALAVAVATQVGLAIPIELERAWIGVAWAVKIPALAWIAARLRVPQLAKIAWVMGALVALRLLLNPAVLVYPVGEGLLFNWLLYGYGVPIAAFIGGAILFRRSGSETLAEALDIGATALAFAYITLSVRQYFHPGDLASTDVMFAEWGTWVVMWLLYGTGLLALYGKTRRYTQTASGTIVGLFAIGVAVLVTGVGQNPLLIRLETGDTMIFNRVLWVYGAPAILAIVFARALRRRELRIPSWVAGSAALLLGFLTLTLEVRHAFHGTVLKGGETTNAEMYTYSLVWVLFAIGLLVAGIVTRGTVVRYGSTVVMLLAVGKVFLVDTAQLKDLYRVFSLLGLGVTLMVLAWIYQRFVFRESR